MKAFYNTHQDLYSGIEPPIYETHNIPEINIIEDHFLIFKKELEDILRDEKKKKLAFKKISYSKTKNWKQIELMIYGLTYPQKADLFPLTYKILSEMNGVSTIYFSFLNKNSEIKGHVGDTDAFYRIHLGISIPEKLPTCGLEVAGKKIGWEEGKCIVFNDIFFHRAWNHANEERIVLIIDLIRPEFNAQKDKVNSGVITTLILSRSYKYIGIIIELLPRIITRCIHPVLHLMVYFYYSIIQKKNS